MIYLDNNSTTPIDKRVLDEMMPYLIEVYGNPASNHEFGIKANNAIKEARKQISNLLNCEPSEIVFTSGATESINLAIKGVASSYQKRGKHIITVQTEHKAVLDTCEYLETQGFEITYLPVKSDGLIDLKVLKNELRSDTILISVMLANNETGVLQPLKEIAEIAQSNNSLFMTDATQAVGKIPVNVDELGIDLLAFSGHKIYAPKGVGALFVRKRKPNRVKIPSLIHGGGHERGMRSGTLNVASIVALGKACELAKKEMKENKIKIKALRDQLETEFLSLDNVLLNGNKTQRMYNVSNLQFKGVDADALMMGLDEIYLSNGSACTSASVEPSHVLIAMGMNEEDAYSSIRFSFGKQNSENDLHYTIQQIKKSTKEIETSLM